MGAGAAARDRAPRYQPTRALLHVPVPPLVIDTDRVLDLGSFGFEIADSAGTAISSVAVTGDDTVEIGLTGVPAAGARLALRVHHGARQGMGGPKTGPRGNLRDSDATPSALARAALRLVRALRPGDPAVAIPAPWARRMRTSSRRVDGEPGHAARALLPRLRAVERLSPRKVRPPSLAAPILPSAATPSRWNPSSSSWPALRNASSGGTLHLCADAGVVVTRHVDDAHGTMLETDTGGHFVEVVLGLGSPSRRTRWSPLRPRIPRSGAPRVLHHKLHANFPVRHEPSVDVEPAS